jgi:hypothetical protein
MEYTCTCNYRQYESRVHICIARSEKSVQNKAMQWSNLWSRIQREELDASSHNNSEALSNRLLGHEVA